MRQKTEKPRSKRTDSSEASGFTLIELLVAMAVIAILVTLVGGNYISIKRKARDAQRKHDLEQMQRALEMYFNDKGRYPDPVDLPTPGNPWQDTEVAGGTLYIKSMPVDPKGADGYVYLYERPNTLSYKIFAYLENDQDPDIQACVVALTKVCGPPPNDCNYGVSSVNLGICE